jgi:tetratricopeptide (TPR) repeat protein
VSKGTFWGILFVSTSLYAQISQNPDAVFPGGPRPPSDPFHLQPSDASGITPVVPDWPQRPAAEPVSGVVSLRELQHPIPKKALRAAYEAQHAFSREHDVPKAIAKMEKAIQIDPLYRDAHCNLGVLYARVGRMTDARAEFQLARDIGPAAGTIYADRALASLALGQHQEAREFASKALALDPDNAIVRVAAQIAQKASPAPNPTP